MHLCLDLELLPGKSVGEQALRDWLRETPARIGMTRISEPQTVWRPPVLTGFVFLAESHIAVHLDHAARYGTADLFTCKEFDAHLMREDIERCFPVKIIHERLLRRGLEYLKEESHAL